MSDAMTDDIGDPDDDMSDDDDDVVEAELVDEPVGGEDGDGDRDVTVEALIDDLDSVVDDRDRLRSELEAVTAERDAYLADSQRLAAELANFRKRVDKRNSELLAQAGGSLVERLLPVLDACDGAIQHGSSDVEPIRSAFYDVLVKEGLEVVNPERGEPFDPNRHEAVSHLADESVSGSPVVESVMRVGYLWNERVLRAAMVTVRG